MNWDTIECQLPTRCQERFMNMCKHHSIELGRMQYHGEYVRFVMKGRDYRKIPPICGKINAHPHIRKRKGLCFELQKARRNWTFYLALVIFVVSLWGQSRYVWRINFGGNYKYTEETLLRELHRQGVTRLMLRSKIVSSDIESNIRRRFDDISWVSAEEDGSHLNIFIKEKKETKVATPKQPGNLVAPCDGVIKKIAVERGVAKVEQGVSVKKGQILIAGAVPVRNEAGENAKENYVEAKGEITLSCTKNVQKEFPAKEKKKSYTGKKNHVFCLRLGEQLISFANPLKNLDNSGKYDIINSVCAENDKTGEERFFEVWHKVFYEYKIMDYTYSEQEIKSLGKTYFRRNVKDIRKADHVVVSSRYGMKQLQNGNWMLQGTIQYETTQLDYKEITISPNDGGLDGENRTDT